MYLKKLSSNFNNNLNIYLEAYKMLDCKNIGYLFVFCEFLTYEFLHTQCYPVSGLDLSQLKTSSLSVLQILWTKQFEENYLANQLKMM